MDRIGFLLLVGLLATVALAGIAGAHTGVTLTYCSTSIAAGPPPHVHVGGTLFLGPAGSVNYCVGVGG